MDAFKELSFILQWFLNIQSSAVWSSLIPDSEEQVQSFAHKTHRAAHQMQSFDVRCVEGHVEPSWMLHFGEAGTSVAYVPSLLNVRCSLRSCVNHSGPFWWDGVQSCSQQQKENEEFQRSGRLLINFIIWEQMLTVVYSGGLQGFWSVSIFQLLLPCLARVWLQPAGLHPDVGLGQAWRKLEVRVFSLESGSGCRPHVDLQISCWFSWTVKQQGEGKWIKKKEETVL